MLVGQEMPDKDLEDPGSYVCEQSIGGDVISCASCQHWYHPSCVGSSMMMIKVLSESEALGVCSLCVLLRFSKEDSTTQESSTTKVDFQSLAHELESMKKDVDKLVEQVSKFSSTSFTVSVSEDTHEDCQLEVVSTTMKEQE